MKFFSFIYFCLALSFINMNAEEAKDYLKSNNVEDLSFSVRATVDQIYLTKEGMFVQIDQAFLPIHALSMHGGQYRCHIRTQQEQNINNDCAIFDFHNRLNDFVTCIECGMAYDGVQYKSCPNMGCRNYKRKSSK